MRLIVRMIVPMVALAGGTPLATAEPVDGFQHDPFRRATGEAFPLGPPKDAGPVVVADLEKLREIDRIDRCEFALLIIATLGDPRQIGALSQGSRSRLQCAADAAARIGGRESNSTPR